MNVLQIDEMQKERKKNLTFSLQDVGEVIQRRRELIVGMMDGLMG